MSVVKLNGPIRIYGNYKVILNRYLEIDKYLIPSGSQI